MTSTEKRLPGRCILRIRPKEYLMQGPSHCGAYSVKGVLSAYGLDRKTQAKEYHTRLFGRITGTTLSRQYWPKVLKAHGIKAEIKSAEKLSDEERLQVIKQLIAKGTPVMILIGNGYYRGTKYKPWLGKIVSHWITVYGYNDDARRFYIYDSALHKKHWKINQPIGNTSRSYSEMLRDWNIGKWQFWTWPVTEGHTHSYIEIASI
ncbi:C39 family peptidase [Candidatus Woesearchaeota archaeon]|nr:C39 family peptidase [Candidatus Woesearchaeota archaeon]